MCYDECLTVVDVGTHTAAASADQPQTDQQAAGSRVSLKVNFKQAGMEASTNALAHGWYMFGWAGRMCVWYITV